MAFLPHTIDGSSRAQQMEYKAATTITPKVGMLLYFSSGLLALCSGTNKPEYICLCDGAQLSSGDVIPVQRILPDTIYETTWSASGTSINLGQKVTIASDGLRVTATTSSGVAEVVQKDETAASGDKVWVRFS